MRSTRHQPIKWRSVGGEPISGKGAAAGLATRVPSTEIRVIWDLSIFRWCNKFRAVSWPSAQSNFRWLHNSDSTHDELGYVIYSFHHHLLNYVALFSDSRGSNESFLCFKYTIKTMTTELRWICLFYLLVQTEPQTPQIKWSSLSYHHHYINISPKL